MKERYLIGIWGQFGGDGHVLADGQAVRTTIITEELINKYGRNNIAIVNTHNWKKSPISFLFKSIGLIFKSRNFLFLPADNGFKVFAPILTLCNILARANLIYIVIGGFLPALLKHKPMYQVVVKNFDHIFVQTNNLKSDLEHFNIKNISILSNLKRLNTIKENDVNINTNKHIQLCILSRLIKEKGVEDAISAVKMANEKLGDTFITLHMYGVIPDYYRADLMSLIEQNSSIVEYKGIVEYNKTVNTLKDYFALLFPTYYHGEGFPGNVVDAYNSALPIIATNWMYNIDVIKDGENGILVHICSPTELCDAILYLYNNRIVAHAIALNNLKASSLYHPDKVLAGLYNVISANNK